MEIKLLKVTKTMSDVMLHRDLFKLTHLNDQKYGILEDSGDAKNYRKKHCILKLCGFFLFFVFFFSIKIT